MLKMKILFIFVILSNYVRGDLLQWQSIVKGLPATFHLTSVISDLKELTAYHVQMLGPQVVCHNQVNISITSNTSQVHQPSIPQCGRYNFPARMKIGKLVRVFKRSVINAVQLSILEYGNHTLAQLGTEIKENVYLKLGKTNYTVEFEPLITPIDSKIQLLINGTKDTSTRIWNLQSNAKNLTGSITQLNTKFQTLKDDFAKQSESYQNPCSIPDDIPGSTHTTEGTDSDGKLTIGGHIQYKCDSGYVLKAGDLKRTCSFGTYLTGQAPVCEAVI